MPKLINDGRQVTEELNMVLGNRPRLLTPLEGQTQHLPSALVFGHYDSRGGAVMVTDAQNIVEGIQAYNLLVGWDANDDVGFEDLLEGSKGVIEVVVVGGELPAGQDVLAGCAEDGAEYALFQVEERWFNEYSSKAGLPTGWQEWVRINAAILIKVTLEQAEEWQNAEADTVLSWVPTILVNDQKRGRWYLKTERRLVPWHCGEDACGLFVTTVAGAKA